MNIEHNIEPLSTRIKLALFLGGFLVGLLLPVSALFILWSI